MVWTSQVVLALGNSAGPTPAPSGGGPGPVRDAWQPDAVAALPAGRPVVLIGTGLAAVDVILSLDDAGFDGPIHAVSRRGLLPQVHRPSAPQGEAVQATGGPVGVITPDRAQQLLASIRSEIRLAAALGHYGRTVVDGLRPRTQALWAALPEAERARLHRHGLRYWDVHCTGPRERLASLGDPLLDGLFATGDAQPGPRGLGLAVDGDGRLLDRAGQASGTLWAIGPLRRGALLETTAIPEIREQAAALARTLPEAAVAVEFGYALEEAL